MAHLPPHLDPADPVTRQPARRHCRIHRATDDRHDAPPQRGRQARIPHARKDRLDSLPVLRDLGESPPGHGRGNVLGQGGTVALPRARGTVQPVNPAFGVLGELGRAVARVNEQVEPGLALKVSQVVFGLTLRSERPLPLPALMLVTDCVGLGWRCPEPALTAGCEPATP